MNQATQPDTVHIRPMRLDDLPQVVEIDQQAFSLPWPKSAYRFELTENPNSLTYVAELVNPTAEPEVIGLCVVWLILDEAHIATLAVHPNHRRTGVARKLMVQALQDSIQHACTSATLEVRAGNQAAQALYREFGFEVVGGRPKYYKDNLEDALIMTVSKLDAAYLNWLTKHSAQQVMRYSDRQAENVRSID
jgi:ribosomal-protein-alanine N-acetyltransferase